MGYWSQSPEGSSFAMDSQLIWGDSPADIIDDAIAKVRDKFFEDWDRYPTKEEIEAGIKFSTNAYDLIYNDEIERPPAPEKKVVD